VQKLDAGPVILQLGTRVYDDETYGELALRLAELGAAALIESLALIELGRATEVPQDESLATYAPKIDREHTRVDWSLDAKAVARVIRAYDPRPGAVAVLGSGGSGQDVKLFGARFAPAPESAHDGEVLSVSEDGMVVACRTGAVRLLQVQPQGKRRMSASDWHRGRGVAPGDRFA
jgi:methionyl-tRNA formyltransferase